MEFLQCSTSEFSSWLLKTLHFWSQFLQSGRFRAELRTLRTFTALQSIDWELHRRTAVTFSIFCSCVSFLWLVRHSMLSKIKKTSFVQNSINQLLLFSFCTAISSHQITVSVFQGWYHSAWTLFFFLNQFPERNFLHYLTCCVNRVSHVHHWVLYNTGYKG